MSDIIKIAPDDATFTLRLQVSHEVYQFLSEHQEPALYRLILGPEEGEAMMPWRPVRLDNPEVHMAGGQVLALTLVVVEVLPTENLSELAERIYRNLGKIQESLDTRRGRINTRINISAILANLPPRREGT